jgi:GNAT superfamily N-acetyltransferase
MQVRGYVMTAPEPGIRARPPPGYDVREARPHESLEDAKTLASVFNDAFSVYDAFWPWRVERVQRYYSDLFKRRRAIVYIAYSRSGDPAGFVEAYIHATLSGGLAGEISLLAVKRSHQGKGLGAYLLSLADEWLRSQGARVVYLDATPLAARLYLKLGFKIIYQYYRARLLVQSLPDKPLDLVLPWSPSSCPRLTA